MRAGQLIRVATGVLRDGPTPLLVARRAIRHFIALHDIQRSDFFPDRQSDVYWQELKAHARTREFVAEPAPGAGMGIGVIFVDRPSSTHGVPS